MRVSASSWVDLSSGTEEYEYWPSCVTLKRQHSLPTVTKIVWPGFRCKAAWSSDQCRARNRMRSVLWPLLDMNLDQSLGIGWSGRWTFTRIGSVLALDRLFLSKLLIGRVWYSSATKSNRQDLYCVRRDTRCLRIWMLNFPKVVGIDV